MDLISEDLAALNEKRQLEVDVRMKEEARDLREVLDRILSYDKERLISRPGEWGKINLEAVKDAIYDLVDACSELREMPLHLLPSDTIRGITGEAQEVINVFDSIDKFDIAAQNPIETITNLQSNARERHDRFIQKIAPWMGFLAYKKGDLARQVASFAGQAKICLDGLTAKQDEARRLIAEIEKIRSAAREAAAASGAAVFTEDFEKSSTECGLNGKRWLIATIVCAVITVLSALGFWYVVKPMQTYPELFQKGTTKIVVLSLFFAATVWCGRNYRALKHLQAVNKHRALSIRTLQAFCAAAHDPDAKNAVLMEAARAVYGNVPTGYVENASGSDCDVKVLEVVRGLMPPKQ